MVDAVKILFSRLGIFPDIVGLRSERRFRESFVLEEINGDLLEAIFGPASKSALKCRICAAVTHAEAAITIATPLHRQTLADLSLSICRSIDSPGSVPRLDGLFWRL